MDRFSKNISEFLIFLSLGSFLLFVWPFLSSMSFTASFFFLFLGWGGVIIILALAVFLNSFKRKQ